MANNNRYNIELISKDFQHEGSIEKIKGINFVKYNKLSKNRDGIFVKSIYFIIMYFT